MGIYHLDRLFKPKDVVVVGASEKPDSIGAAILRNLQSGGFAGRILPVNPKYKRIGELEVYPSVRKIKGPVDLAVIATPIATVPSLIEACASSGIHSAIVVSAGGKETGKQGKRIEEEILQQARRHRIRLIGPNCLGVMVTRHHMNAGFATEMPLAGKLAFISQSGAMCTAILDLAFKERIGFSHFVSLGSMADVDFGDMIDYLGYAYDVSSILLYIESLTNVRKFMSAARSVSHTKPIIALKAGKSAAGARAAASHTGALAGEDDVYDAAFKRAGIIRVNTIQDLFDCAELMSKSPLPRGSRLGIISNGGGPAVMATDAVANHAAEPEPLEEETREALDVHLPPFWSKNNPIDILGDATAQRFSDTIATCVASHNFDGLLVMFVPQAVAKADAVAEALMAVKQNCKLPIIACWMGGRDVQSAVERMNLAGIPTYETPERAVRVFYYMVQYVRNQELIREIPPRFDKQLDFKTEAVRQLIQAHDGPESEFLTESASKEILSGYGLNVIPTHVAADADAAEALSEQLGFPLAMKIVSPDITHKTEVNGIRLDVRNTGDMRCAFEEILKDANTHRPGARIQGISLQPFVRNADYELLLGAKRDPNFGPVIVFGIGGIYTEVVRDRSIGLPPLNRLLAHRLMEETKAHRLLAGFRNRPPADMALLEEMLVRLSQLLIDLPEIQELDLNPVVVKDGVPIAVDARIRLAPSPLRSPLHLVISPYPTHYECHVTLKNGQDIFLRPIRPEDGPLFNALFGQMSAASLYNRFCRQVCCLSSEMLFRMTQIDYDREMALVAIEAPGGEEKMVGAARIINDPEGTSAEFAIMVGDPWHGQGIGAALLTALINLGRRRGLETIWGYVLQENKQMLRLGKKVGFTSSYDPDVEMKILTIDLKTAAANAAASP